MKFIAHSRNAKLVAIYISILIIVGIPLSILVVQKQGLVVTPTLSATSITNPTVQNVEQSILDNIQANGFDGDRRVNYGLGGLWINWRYGSNPLQTNFDGSGRPYEPGNSQPPSHDILTDLRYIHNLWSYKTQYPSDDRYDSEIARYTSIIKSDFANPVDERGWLYDEFIAIYHLSHDTFYKEAALKLVSAYAREYDPEVGSIYKKNSTTPRGSYRVDLTLESGTALIQAGVLFGNASWQQIGQNIVNYIYAHAYIPRYHLFADMMDNVLQADGSPNPEQDFYISHYRNYVVRGNSMKMGEISQMIISLLDTYQATHNQDFLNKATDLLDNFSLPNDPLGMWDYLNSGYYFSVTFNGTSPSDPGTITISRTHKEAGRQVGMLEAFHLANLFTNGRYKHMEDLVLTVALNKAYYAPGHGVLFEVNADWTPITFPDDTPANNVTTEAMGIELESLFSLSGE